MDIKGSRRACAPTPPLHRWHVRTRRRGRHTARVHAKQKVPQCIAARTMPSWMQISNVQGSLPMLHVIYIRSTLLVRFSSRNVRRSRSNNMGVEQAGLRIWTRRSRLHISSLVGPWARRLERRPG